jgi:molybdopterin-binding protein
MNFATIGRIAGAVGLTLALAGCIDMTQDLTVTSATTAKATMTMTMGSDIYAMVKAANTSDTKTEDKFCAKEGEALTENADGSATCVSTSEGTFEELKFDEGGSKPVFTAQADGSVRVAIPTKDMMGDMGKETDPQTQEMMKQMFENHFITLRVGGSEVTDTNMTLSDDHKTAEIKIAFTDLINGTAKLPEELYAVVTP